MNLLFIKFKAKNNSSLKKCLLILNLIFIKFNIYSGSINSQSKVCKNVFTVLKSPHVFKTAQDQFGFILYFNRKQISTFKYKKLIFLLKHLNMNILSDVYFTLKMVRTKNIQCLKHLNYPNKNSIQSLNLIGEILFKI